MNKITSIFVMLMLVMSFAPAGFVLADGNDTNNSRGSSSNHDSDDGSDDNSEDYSDNNDSDKSTNSNGDSDKRVRIEYRDGNNQIRNEVRIKDGKIKIRHREESRDKDGKNKSREQGKVRLDHARERVHKAREQWDKDHERLKNAREQYHNAREKISGAREKYRECKGNNSYECEDAREKIRVNAKPFLDNSANMVLDALYKMVDRIEASDMNNTLKEELLAELEKHITDIEAAQTSVSKLNDNSTDEEIRATAAEVKDVWSETKASLKLHAGNVAHKKLMNAYEHMEKLSSRLDNAITKLEEKGYDVGTAVGLNDEFKAKLSDTHDLLDEARSLYDEDDTKGGNTLLREAHRTLKDARKLVRDIVKEIKNIANDADFSDDSDEVEDTTDDTSKGLEHSEDSNEDSGSENETSVALNGTNTSGVVV